MRLQTELVLPQARYLSGKAAPTKDEPKVTLAFRAALTTEVAEIFGCRELVYAGSVPRSGVASMAPEGEELDCALQLRHDNLAFSAVAERVGGYVVKFTGTGPELSFHVKLKGHGHLVDDLATQVKVDPLEITLKPAQMDLGLSAETETEAEDDSDDDDDEDPGDREEIADIVSELVQ
jgi:hypothetical protein